MVLLTAGFCQNAQAVLLKVSPRVNIGVQYDNNVYRAPDDNNGNARTAEKISDISTVIGIGTALKMQYSMQALTVNADFEKIQYNEQSNLDYARYQVETVANLKYTSRLHLDLADRRDKRLESFSYRDDNQKGFIQTQSQRAELRYDVTPHWSMLAKADRYTSKATLQGSQDYDIAERGTEVGVRYSLANLSSLDFALRSVDGEFPKRQGSRGDGREREYTQSSAIARIKYSPSVISEFSGNIAYTQREHADASVKDFSGITGRLGYGRQWSGKTQLRADVYRDLYYVEEANANYLENIGMQLTIEQRISAKLSARVLMERSQSQLIGADNSVNSRTDQVAAFTASLEYKPLYRLRVLPKYRYEQRKSTRATSGFSDSTLGVDVSYDLGSVD